MTRPRSTPSIHPLVLRVLIGVSFVLLVLATWAFFYGDLGEAEGRVADQLWIAWLMGSTGVLLLIGEQNDDRARWLGQFLVFSATAFCYKALEPGAESSASLIEALPAHLAVMAVAPYCLWRLAAVFPRGMDRAAIRRTLHVGTTVAWLFAWVGLLANLAIWLGYEPASALDHGPGESWFHLLSVLINAGALLLIALRWFTASQRDRRRAGPFLATLAVLAFMLSAIVAASLLRTPLDTTRTAFGAAVVALLPCLVGAVRQRGLYVRILGAGPLLRRTLEWSTWAVLAAPVVLFCLRWSSRDPTIDLQLLFAGSLIAVAIAFRPRSRAAQPKADEERSSLLRDAPKLGSRLQRDDWLDRVERWSGATTSHLYAAHPEVGGVLLDPLPEAGKPLQSLLYLQRSTLDLDHLDPLQFESLHADTRRWIAEEQIAVIEPVLSSTDHLLGLLALGRPRAETTHRSETLALLPILAAGLAPSLSRLGSSPPHRIEAHLDPVFAAAVCAGCDAVYSSLVERCPDCVRDLSTLDQPLLIADNYQLEKRLGRGSWGSVFRARDLLLERTVALKFFHLGGDSGANALLREARALVSLRGPQLAEIYSAVHTDQGLVLITELLEGGVLADRIEAGKPTMDWQEAFQFGIELLNNLKPLHDQDLLHGDIKPSNLAFDREGRLKLIDFGMVRALQDGSLPSTPTSGGLANSTLLPGGQPGTPIYSPPEAWEAQPVGVAGDLWPVAVLLWELITGEHPFARMGDNMDQLGRRIRRGKTNPWPAGVSCPPRVRWFFDRALHVDPGRRHVDLPAMERALQSALGST